MTLTGFYKLCPDGTLEYDFHPGHEQAWESEARFVCVLSGTQGGKTTFGPPRLHREIKTRGPGDYLVAAPTYPLMYVKAPDEGSGEVKITEILVHRSGNGSRKSDPEKKQENMAFCSLLWPFPIAKNADHEQPTDDP